MARQPRYRVVPTRDEDWAVKKGETTIATTDTKEHAVDIGRDRAKADEGQLVIHKRDGKIQTEHTYGHDPKSRKG